MNVSVVLVWMKAINLISVVGYVSRLKKILIEEENNVCQN